MRINAHALNATLVVALGVMLSGCANSRIEALEKQTAQLDKKLKDMQKAYAAQSVSVEDMETRLFLLQDELDTLRKRPAPPERLPVVRVRPRPGPRATPGPNAPVKEYDELTPDGRVVGRQPKRATPPPAPTPRKKSGLSADDRNAASLYKTATEHRKNGRFEDAIGIYTRLVENFPNHGLADNAVYWIAECYYVRGLWQKALQTFQLVIANYPLGNKAPDAMFKLGLCYHQMRDYSQAREVWEQLRDMFPGSPAAQLAAARLEKVP
jgi:tol-pal system protein YbgF